MRQNNITDDEAIKITDLPILERKPFSHVLRQSGLNPNTIER